MKVGGFDYVTKSLEIDKIEEKEVKMSDKSILDLVRHYTREAGVRGLEKQIAKVIRNRAKFIAMDETYESKLSINLLNDILGVPIFQKDKDITNKNIASRFVVLKINRVNIIRPLLQLLLATLFVSTLFSYSGQLSCKCGCGKNNMSQRFLDELDNLESVVNIKFQINSGSRCSSYNRQNGGSAISFHLQGLSVDISDIGWTDRQRKKLIRRARRSGYFTKVLTYYDSNHIHIEADPYGSDFVHHKIYKDSDADISLLQTKKIGIIKIVNEIIMFLKLPTLLSCVL